jgi:hypothetical protein
MLPTGLSAHLAPKAERDALLDLLPDARTVAHLLVGACSCDLFVARQADAHEDERHLRAGYRRLNLPRDVVIRSLERHRRPHPRPRQPHAGWPAALAGFVAEHARNAGPTLYHLGFESGRSAPDGSSVIETSVRDVRAKPGKWIQEGQTVLVK